MTSQDDSGRLAPGRPVVPLEQRPDDDRWRERLRHVGGRVRFAAAVAARPRAAGPTVLLGPRARLTVGPGGSFRRGRGCVLDADVHLVAHAPVVFGSGVYVGRGSQLVALAGLTLGDRVLLGERVSIHDEDHTPGGGYAGAPVSVGSDAWLGAGSVLLAGAVVGDGAVVAAGSVVRGTVPAGSLVGGVPARLLRRQREQG